MPPITKEKLEAALKALSESEDYGKILRSKGMIESADVKGEWYYFDMVPGEYEIRNGAPEYTGKVCVIGAELKEAEIKKLFI